MKVNRWSYCVLIDTGAQISLVNKKVIKKIEHEGLVVVCRDICVRVCVCVLIHEISTEVITCKEAKLAVFGFSWKCGT